MLSHTSFASYKSTKKNMGIYGCFFISNVSFLILKKQVKTGVFFISNLVPIVVEINFRIFLHLPLYIIRLPSKYGYLWVSQRTYSHALRHAIGEKSR